VTVSPVPQDVRERRTLDFFADWAVSFPVFRDSFALLSDDCVWDQRPVPKLVGARGAQRFLTVAHRVVGLATCDVEVLRVASTGDTVLVERVDRLRRADGSLIAAAPAVGVLTYTGDRVTHWRDYFDAAEFGAQVVATSVGHLGLGLVRRVRAIAPR
jgi:limonene-1,2-epoxide hydrolase